MHTFGIVVGVIAMWLSAAPATAEMASERRKGASDVMQAPAPAPAEPRRGDGAIEQPPPELVEENPLCQQYAQRAVDQYRRTSSSPECALPSDERWHRDFKRHYEWCLTAADDRRVAEQNARDEHLYRCGAQRR